MRSIDPSLDTIVSRTSLVPRHVFVCGLHRSGTTLMARLLAEHPEIGGFKNTGVIEDEGQYLQSVLPIETRLGGVGRFGFDPRAHMTEASPLATGEAAARLKAEWGRYWPKDRAVLVEKTPSTLLRMRLMQVYFPGSLFVVMTRHPVASALATAKWTEGNLFALICHWLRCHQIARADTSRIEHVLWTSYEALIRQPSAVLRRITARLELAPHAGWPERFEDQNQNYFAEWRLRVGDGERAIRQIDPLAISPLRERIRGRIERLKTMIERQRGRAIVTTAQRHDALDAATAFEAEANEFGYSFSELDRYPAEN